MASGASADFGESYRAIREEKQMDGNATSRLAAAVEEFFIRYRERLYLVHLGMFGIFLAIILVPVLLPASAPFVRFANYALWGIWFPFVLLSTIFVGRLWCGVLCPMGAAAEWANSAGLQRAIPRFLRWEGLPVASFILITILGQTAGVRTRPEAVAEIFGGTMLAALAIGFLYGKSKRAWCRHMCPIGLLLGVFSRLGAVEFRPRRLLPGGEGYSEKGVCPTMIDLGHKTESRHCIECFRCVSPNGEGGIHLHFRKPGGEIEAIRDHNANPAEIWFLFLGAGLALGGFLWTVTPLYERLVHAIGLVLDAESWPAWLVHTRFVLSSLAVSRWLVPISITVFMLGCMVACAAVLRAMTGLSAWLAGGKFRFRQRFTELGYQFAPVAMVSLLLGLGGKLFDPLRHTSLGENGMGALKGMLFLAGFIWSLYLGNRILERQGVPRARRWLPLLPGLAGSLLLALAWLPVISVNEWLPSGISAFYKSFIFSGNNGVY